MIMFKAFKDKLRDTALGVLGFGATTKHCGCFHNWWCWQQTRHTEQEGQVVLWLFSCKCGHAYCVEKTHTGRSEQAAGLKALASSSGRVRECLDITHTHSHSCMSCSNSKIFGMKGKPCSHFSFLLHCPEISKARVQKKAKHLGLISRYLHILYLLLFKHSWF